MTQPIALSRNQQFQQSSSSLIVSDKRIAVVRTKPDLQQPACSTVGWISTAPSTASNGRRFEITGFSSSLLSVTVDDASLIHPTFRSTIFYMQVHPAMTAFGAEPFWALRKLQTFIKARPTETGLINRRVDQRSAIHREQWQSF